MLHDLFRIQRFIDHPRRHADWRFGDQHRALGNGRQNRQLFADALCQHGSPQNAVGYVRSQLNPTLHQLLTGKLQPEQTVHSEQHRRRIGASSRHACCHRDVLIQCNAHPSFQMKFLYHHLCCLICDIPRIIREIVQVGRKLNPRFFPGFQPYIIIQINRLHDHTYIVISIFPSPKYVQSQVYFGKRL